MAETRIVGRIAIRVMPDTSGFRPKLEADLNAQTRDVEAQVPVTAVLDADRLPEELQAEKSRLQAESDRHPIELRAKIESLIGELSKRIAEVKASEAFNTPLEFQTKLRPLRLSKTEAQDALGFKQAYRAAERELFDTFHARIQDKARKSPLELTFTPDKPLTDYSSTWYRKLRTEWQKTGAAFGIKVEPDNRTLGNLRRDIQKVMHKTFEARVVPYFDRDTFTRNLGKAIYDKRKNWVSGFDRALGGITIKPEVKAQDIDKSLHAAWERVAKRAQKLTAEIDARFSRSKLAAQWEAAKRWLGKFETKIKPTLDQTAVAWTRTALRKIFDRVNVMIEPRLSKLALTEDQLELKLWAEEAEKLLRLKVKTVLDKKSVKSVTVGLAALSGGRLFKKLVSLEPFKHLDEQLPVIAALSILFAQLSNYVISLVSDTLALGRSIGQIVPAALPLPGIFMGAAVSMFVLVTAFSKLKDVMPSIVDRWNNLRDAIGKNFWSKAQKPFEKFFDSMGGGFKQVSLSMGSFTGKALRNFNKIVSPRLPLYFTTLSHSFDIIGEAGPSIAKIIRSFGDLGAIYMPRLARWTEKLIDRFSAWLDLNFENGNLSRWIDTGVQRMGELWRVVSGVYGVFKNLGIAAEQAGGATLKSLGDALHTISNTIASPQFQERLINVFRSARLGIENMVSYAGPATTKMFKDIGDNAHNLLPLIGKVSGQLVRMIATVIDQPIVGQAMMKFFLSLQEAFNLLEPSIANVGKGLSGVLNVISTMATSFAPLVNLAIGALAKHTTGLADSVQAVIRTLSGSLVRIMTDLLPTIERMSPALLEIFENVVKGIADLMPVIVPLLDLLSRALAVFASLPAPLQALGVGFLALKVVVAGGLSKAMVSLLESVMAMRLNVPAVTAGIRGLWTASLGLKGALLAVGAAWAAANLVGGAVSENITAGLPKVEAYTAMFTQLAAKNVQASREWADSVHVLAGMTSRYDTGSLEGGLMNIEQFLADIVGMHASGAVAMMNAEWDKMAQSLASMPIDQATAAFARYSDELQLGRMSVDEIVTRMKPWADQLRNQAAAVGVFNLSNQQLFDMMSGKIPPVMQHATEVMKTSATTIRKSAEDIRGDVFGTFSRLDRQAGILTGKAKLKVIQNMTEMRAKSLKELEGLTAGSDKETVKAAEKANTNMQKLAEKIPTLTGKARTEALKKLETMRSDYEATFGDILSLVETDASKIPQALRDSLTGTGSKGNVPKGRTAQEWSRLIGEPVATAVQTGLTEIDKLPQKISEVDLATPVNTIIGTAKTAASTGMDELAGIITTKFTDISVNIATGAGAISLVPATQALIGQVSISLNGLSGVGKTAGTGLVLGIVEGMAGAEGLLSGFAARYALKAIEIGNTTAIMVRDIKAKTRFSLSSNGEAITKSLATGMVSRGAKAAVLASCQELIQYIKDHKGPISYDRVMLKPAGKAIVDGLITGVRSRFYALKDAMQDATRIVEDAQFGASAISVTRANSASAESAAAASLSLGTNVNVSQFTGDILIPVKDIEGIRNVEDLGKTLRRKRRQAGGK